MWPEVRHAGRGANTDHRGAEAVAAEPLEHRALRRAILTCHEPQHGLEHDGRHGHPSALPGLRDGLGDTPVAAWLVHIGPNRGPRARRVTSPASRVGATAAGSERGGPAAVVETSDRAAVDEEIHHPPGALLRRTRIRPDDETDELRRRMDWLPDVPVELILNNLRAELDYEELL